MDNVVSSSAVVSPVVVIESPFAGNLETNLFYADCLLFDSLTRGEVPFMGHLLYTRVFDDSNPHMREAGIRAHLTMIARADYIVVGRDLGEPSSGMRAAIAEAERLGTRVVERYLGPNWNEIRLHPTPGIFSERLYQTLPKWLDQRERG